MQVHASNKAIFISAVIRGWTENDLLAVYPDYTIGEVKDAMIEEYNQCINKTNFAPKFKAYLDAMTITLKVEMHS